MEKDSFGKLIKDGLSDAADDIEMSPALKSRILKNTIGRSETLYERLLKFMDKTIEISFPSAIVAGIVLVAFIFTGFISVWSIKGDKSLVGYTSVKVINVGGSDIIVDKNSGGVLDGIKNKD